MQDNPEPSVCPQSALTLTRSEGGSFSLFCLKLALHSVDVCVAVYLCMEQSEMCSVSFFNVSFFFQSFSSSSQKLLLLLQFLCTIYQRWKAELGFSWKSNIFKVVQTISSEVPAYWTFSVQVAPNITQCTKQ